MRAWIGISVEGRGHVQRWSAGIWRGGDVTRNVWKHKDEDTARRGGATKQMHP